MWQRDTYTKGWLFTIVDLLVFLILIFEKQMLSKRSRGTVAPKGHWPLSLPTVMWHYIFEWLEFILFPTRGIERGLQYRVSKEWARQMTSYTSIHKTMAILAWPVLKPFSDIDFKCALERHPKQSIIICTYQPEPTFERLVLVEECTTPGVVKSVYFVLYGDMKVSSPCLMTWWRLLPGCTLYVPFDNWDESTAGSLIGLSRIHETPGKLVVTCCDIPMFTMIITWDEKAEEYQQTTEQHNPPHLNNSCDQCYDLTHWKCSWICCDPDSIEKGGHTDEERVQLCKACANRDAIVCKNCSFYYPEGYVYHACPDSAARTYGYSCMRLRPLVDQDLVPLR